MKDEKILYETKPMNSLGIIAIIVGICLLVVFIGVIFIVIGISSLKTRIIITNKRFAVVSWFSTKEMRLDKVESVEKSFGSKVVVWGSGGSKLIVQVDKPGVLVNELHDALDNLKK